MKIEKWQDAPLGSLALKLCEESGEVANEILIELPHDPSAFDVEYRSPSLERIAEEARQVQQIARLIAVRAERELQKRGTGQRTRKT